MPITPPNWKNDNIKWGDDDEDEKPVFKENASLAEAPILRDDISDDEGKPVFKEDALLAGESIFKENASPDKAPVKKCAREDCIYSAHSKAEMEGHCCICCSHNINKNGVSIHGKQCTMHYMQKKPKKQKKHHEMCKGCAMLFLTTYRGNNPFCKNCW